MKKIVSAVFFLCIAATATFGQANFSQRGMATQEMREDGLVAGHPTLPINSMVKVTNVATGKEIMVEIIVRIPTSASRVIDLSPAAAAALGLGSRGEVMITNVPAPRARPETPPANPSITIVNNTGNTINALHIRQTGTSSWTRYAFANNQTVVNGQSITLQLPNPINTVNRYDIELEDVNGKRHPRNNILVSANARIEIGSAPSQENPSVTQLFITNDTGYDIYVLYVRPSGSREWSEDILSSGEILKDGGYFISRPPVPLSYEILYDFLAVDEDGDMYIKRKVRVSNIGRIVFTPDDWDGDIW
jgi:hypothetical protein